MSTEGEEGDNAGNKVGDSVRLRCGICVENPVFELLEIRYFGVPNQFLGIEKR